jgi:hypothetical protein
VHGTDVLGYDESARNRYTFQLNLLALGRHNNGQTAGLFYKIHGNGLFTANGNYL